MARKTKAKLETENKKLQKMVRLLGDEVAGLSGWVMGLTIYALITSVIIALIIIPK